MLPGKKYTPEDILQILRKRIWIVLVPFAVVAALTAIVARKLPDRFRSDALIQVVPQRVPEAYVKSTVTSPRIEDRLQSISQQILSRTRLESVIQDFNLYAEERKNGIMEDIVVKMRTDIHVDPVVKGDAFRVSYVGSEPRTVMKVTERLATLFIEGNIRDREVLAEGTSQFLEAELEDARRRLIEHEKKLEAYRRQHSGELPSQLDSNMQAIQNNQLQIQSILESLNRDRDRRATVDRQRADLQAETEVAAQRGPSTPAADGAPTEGTTAQQLAQARATLQGLELRFKPGHPDLNLWQRRIRDLEKKADAEALQAPVSGGPASTPTSPAAAARQRRLNDLTAELQQLDRQIAYKQAQEANLRSAVTGYQARIAVAPNRESEMTELTRDYTTLQTMYTTLLTKKEDSKMTANLERRQIGEQFKLLDPARLPEKPFSPDRRTINMMGMFAGLVVGLALVGLLEYRDSSFKTDDELAGVLALPVLAVVPLMRSEDERRLMLRRKILVGVGLGSTVTACLAVVVYTLLR